MDKFKLNKRQFQAGFSLLSNWQTTLARQFDVREYFSQWF